MNVDTKAISQKLWELSLSSSPSCICVSSSEISPDLAGWRARVSGWHPGLPNQDRNCITMKQVEKRASTGYMRKATPSKYKSIFQLHKNFSDKYHFRHHNSLQMFALEYRAVNASAYRQMNRAEYRALMSERNEECCCHQCPLVQLLPDMVQQNTAVMNQTQQLLDKLEQFATQEKQMSLQVEWKFKNVSGRMRRFKMARTSPKLMPESPQVVSQLAESMRVMTYFKDQDPLSMKERYASGRCRGATPIASYPDWGEDTTCTMATCAQSYNTCVVKPVVLVDYSHCIKPAPRIMAEKKSSHLVVKDTSEMEPNEHDAGRCVAMHQVMQSSWKRRPPLLERRKSAKTSQLHKDKIQSACSTPTIPKEVVRDKVALYNIELSNHTAASLSLASASKKQPPDTQPLAPLKSDTYRVSLHLRKQK